MPKIIIGDKTILVDRDSIFFVDHAREGELYREVFRTKVSSKALESYDSLILLNGESKRLAVKEGFKVRTIAIGKAK